MSQRYIGSSISPTAAPSTSISTTGVWSLNDQYQAKNVGNWPLYYGSDPYFPYVTMLLPGNGTNGAQNNTFLDSSTNNFTITRNGNTTQGTYSPYGANWSNYFDGSGDYLTTSASSLLGSDFTIEFFVYFNTFTSGDANYQNLFGVNNAYNVAGNFLFLTNYNGTGYSAGAMSIMHQNSQKISLPAGTFSLGVWTHVALVRQGGTSLKIYVNGTHAGTATIGSGDQWGASGVGYVVGSQNGFTGRSLNGYLSNVRVLNGTALYTSTFTPPTTPLNPITNTSLLTCQNNRIFDSSPNNLAITTTGNTSVQRFSPFEPAVTTTSYYSGYFNGSSAYLTAPVNAAFAFGTGDFTIEAWIYDSGTTAAYAQIVGASTYGSANEFLFSLNGTTRTLYAQLGSTGGASSSGTVTANTWNHVAIVRSGTTVTFYINGTSSGSYTDSDSVTSTIVPSIGASNNNNADSRFKGSISNVRITKGAALYTSTFTPSTTPLTTTVSSGTVSLLTCQSSAFIDNSTNAFAITVNGGAKPIATAPFASVVTSLVPYSASLIGGSAYFDGSGDYLTIPSNAQFSFGTGDFTIEGWFNIPSLPANTYGKTIYDSRPDSTNGNYPAIFISNTGYLQYFLNGVAAITSGTITPINQWNHFALTRSSGTVNLFLNGNVVGTPLTGNVTSLLSDVIKIGANAFRASAPDTYFNGFISNLRVIKGQALYATTFAPPLAPVTAISNTSLLVNATNAGIIDNAEINDLETVGNAQISTAQYKFGGSSILFDGTGDWLTFPTSYFPSTTGTAFTFEFWIYPTRASTTETGIISSGNIELNIVTSPAGQLRFDLPSGVTNVLNSGATSVTANAWNHVAITRTTANAYTMYLNGVNVGTGSSSTAITGVTTFGYKAANSLQGYIQDLRVTNGIVRYTGNFTPPTAAFPTV